MAVVLGLGLEAVVVSTSVVARARTAHVDLDELRAVRGQRLQTATCLTGTINREFLSRLVYVRCRHPTLEPHLRDLAALAAKLLLQPGHALR